MSLIKLVRQCLFLMVLTTGYSYGGNISYISVDKAGSGATLKEATLDAISQALMQVNGGAISSETSSLLEEASMQSNDSDSYKHGEAFQQKVRSATQGLIKGYEVLEQEQVDDKWDVLLKVTISKYKQSNQTKRLRMAVLPLKITTSDYNEQSSEFATIYRQGLIDYLTQTRKFAMLDRDFLDQQKLELSEIENQKSPTDEYAKIGQRLAVDYIVVGYIQDAYSRKRTIVMKSSGKEISVYDYGITLLYRVIDVVTGQIKFSEKFVKSGSQTNGLMSLSSISPLAVKAIGQKVMNAIYPIRVEAVNGDIITLGQGGNTVKMGQVMNLIELGERIIDSYTKESLGREEVVIGRVEIIDVLSKHSKAKIITSSIDITDSFKSKKYLVRPLKKKTKNLQSASPKPKMVDAVENLKKESENDW